MVRTRMLWASSLMLTDRAPPLSIAAPMLRGGSGQKCPRRMPSTASSALSIVPTGGLEEQRSSLVLERALPLVFATVAGAAILIRRVKCSGSNGRYAMASSMECGESDAMRHVDTCRAAVCRM